MTSAYTALDAPPMMRPKRRRPEGRRPGETPPDWRDIREPGSPDSEWFERVAVDHMNYVTGIPVFELTPPGTALLDVVEPNDRFAVAQVKSGKTAHGVDVLASTKGAAHVPGSLSLTRAAWVYTESGYTQGTLAYADDHGHFLWTIDKRGFVRPWSAAARFVESTTMRTHRPERHAGPVTLVEAAAQTAKAMGSPEYERALSVYLDRCAFEGYDDRVAARRAFIAQVRDLWISGGLPERGLWGGWDMWMLRTLEQGELTGKGADAAERILAEVEATVWYLGQDVSSRPNITTGHDAWAQMGRRMAWEFAREKFHRMAVESYFIDSDQPLPPSLSRAADAAWGPGAKWVTPEAVWRDAVLTWDAVRAAGQDPNL